MCFLVYDLELRHSKSSAKYFSGVELISVVIGLPTRRRGGYRSSELANPWLGSWILDRLARFFRLRRVLVICTYLYKTRYAPLYGS